jgi:hypothetical protein
MAALWETSQQQRLADYRAFAGLLAGKQALRPDLAAEHAADILFSLLSPEVYLSFTAQRGWTPGQWEQWINHTLAATILR